QALRGLVVVRGERGNVHEPDDPIVVAGGGDDRTSVGMTDEDGRAADPPQRAHHGIDISLERVEAVLRRHDLVPVGLKYRDHLAEARTVGPEAVGEHDAGSSWHVFSCAWCNKKWTRDPGAQEDWLASSNDRAGEPRRLWLVVRSVWHLATGRRCEAPPGKRQARFDARTASSLRTRARALVCDIDALVLGFSSKDARAFAV